MGYRLSGLPVDDFEHLFGRPDDELRRSNILRLRAEEGYPCRITLAHAVVGEPVLLLNYEHQSLPTPYRSSGPIFVRESARETAVVENFIPSAMRTPLYSVRAYDAAGMMVDADVAQGPELEPLIERLLSNRTADFLHLHHARRGCFACRVDRA